MCRFTVRDVNYQFLHITDLLIFSIMETQSDSPLNENYIYKLELKESEKAHKVFLKVILKVNESRYRRVTPHFSPWENLSKRISRKEKH